MNPGLFTVMQNKEVAGRRCQMVEMKKMKNIGMKSCEATTEKFLLFLLSSF